MGDIISYIFRFVNNLGRDYIKAGGGEKEMI
jgi:hypothetical protein